MALRDVLQEVAGEVQPAPLPRRRGEVFADRVLQTFVRVAHDEARTGEPAAAQAPTELAQNASESESPTARTMISRPPRITLMSHLRVDNSSTQKPTTQGDAYSRAPQAHGLRRRAISPIF